MAFIPIMTIYVLYIFKAHTLIPAVSTWPIQRQIIINAKDMMRHRLWPWTIEVEVEKAKNSKRHPFIRHIVAVGDLHGDLPNARRVLDFSGVTDEFGDWSGDVDFFVQTGDIIDRCAEHLSTIFFYILLIGFPLEGTILFLYLIGWIDFAHKHYTLAAWFSHTSEIMNG